MSLSIRGSGRSLSTLKDEGQIERTSEEFWAPKTIEESLRILTKVPENDAAPTRVFIHRHKACYIQATQNPKGVFTLGDAQSLQGLTSKIPALGWMLNFDADVKKMTARHQCESR